MSVPSLVQFADTHSSSSLAFPNNVTEGNMLVVIGGVSSSDTSDTLGNKYEIFQCAPITDGDYDYVILVCPASKSSGANTVSMLSELSYWAIAEFTPGAFQGQSGVGTGGTSPTFSGEADSLLVGMCTAPINGTSITGVGGNFTQASGSYESHVSLEYETLSSSGSVGSDFTVSGTAAEIGTSAFTLASIPTPLADTPSIVQTGTIEGVFSTNVTEGNSILVIASQSILSTGTLSISDTRGNSYTTVASNVSNFGSFYNGVWVFFCAASKSSGANTITISGGEESGVTTFCYELSPCVVATSSGVQTGTMTGADITSESIAAYAGQLLFSYSTAANSAGLLGFACSGFYYPLTDTDYLNHNTFAQAAVLPVTASGNFNSDYNVWQDTGSFSSPYQTGIIALGLGTAATP